MTGYETASGYNVRGTNGSAYEFMGSNPFMQSGYTPGTSPWQGLSPQQQSQQQVPFAQQNPFLQTQNPYAQVQNPYLQQWQQPYSQQSPFIGQQPFGVPPIGMPGIQQGLPNLGFFPQQQASQWRTPGIGFQQTLQQGMTPAVTTKSLELNLTIPVHRIAGHHPQEIYQYLTQVVLPVLVDGLTRRALTGDPGQSVTLHLNGECVARITL